MSTRPRYSRCLMALMLVLPAACDNARPRGNTPADVRAIQLIRHHGCGTCHTIPGVPSANGVVGPQLGGLKDRKFIGGVVTNTPENLARWIEAPRALAPRTAMPTLGVKETEAREIAAFLYNR
jgi:cytochrome c2